MNFKTLLITVPEHYKNSDNIIVLSYAEMVDALEKARTAYPVKTEHDMYNLAGDVGALIGARILKVYAVEGK